MVSTFLLMAFVFFVMDWAELRMRRDGENTVRREEGRGGDGEVMSEGRFPKPTFLCPTQIHIIPETAYSMDR